MTELTKRDISNRQDIELLVDSFYKKVLKDEVIGFFFTEVAPINWDKHMPIMYDFWETTLFHKAIYKGNPITKHVAINIKSSLTKEHFDRWTSLFANTVDQHFEGMTATLAKQRATSIATVMQIKISQLNG